MFKVVPDQLRISDGWVRCGQCDEVFDANANLHTEALAPAAEEYPASPLAPTSPDPDWAASLRFASDDPQPPADTSPPSEVSVPVEPDQPSTENLVDESVDRELLDDFLSHSPKALAQSPGADIETPPLESNQGQDLDGLGSAAPRYTQAVQAETSETQAISFMRGARGNGFWQRTWVKALLGVAACLLLVLLVAQHAYTERDRIAAYQPEVVPALELMCEWAGCKLAPLQTIESVVIDSSSFTKVRTDLYRLNVAIKNVGAVPVSPPSLELTLTDLQDQSLVRRILSPQEIGWTAPSLGPGAEFTGTLPLAIKTSGGMERISGYRLLAFYP